MRNLIIIFSCLLSFQMKAQNNYIYTLPIFLNGKPVTMVDSIEISTNGTEKVKRLKAYKAINDTFRISLSKGTHYLTFWFGDKMFKDYITLCGDCPGNKFYRLAPEFSTVDTIGEIVYWVHQEPEHYGLFPYEYKKRYSRKEFEKILDLKTNFILRLLISPKGELYEAEVIGLMEKEIRYGQLILKGIPFNAWKPAKHNGRAVYYEKYISRNELLRN